MYRRKQILVAGKMPNSQRIKVIPKRFCGTSLNLGSSCTRFHVSHQRKGNQKFRFGSRIHHRAVNRISKDIFFSNKSAGMSAERTLRKEGERRRQSDCPIRPPPSPDKNLEEHTKNTPKKAPQNSEVNITRG